jgi:hypothetical protein
MVTFPPVMPFTCHVTAVLVEVVASLRLTTAEKSTWLLIPTEPEMGLIDTDFTVGVVLLFPPPPQAPRVRIPAIATASVNNVRFDIRFRVIFKFALVLKGLTA